ncbi:MAG: Na(+)-translocating NADH-quinone reductase subunit A [Planctomycetes bacterium]|nr:Na(+)-translocating NADH-quinone reductase subunit A [Planctomycetota bacterium]
MRFELKKGLDLPIQGAPRQEIEVGAAVRTVALLGADSTGLKPTMAVQAGERVKLGQILFSDKQREGVHFTSPAGGEVVAVHRGEKRVLVSVVIRIDGDEAVSFEKLDAPKPNAAKVREVLSSSGLWTSFRTRPFSRIPPISAEPKAIFVNAMDTNPLAADPAVVLRGQDADFIAGLRVVASLCPGQTYLCTAPNAAIPGIDLDAVKHASFAGPHPAGLVGTHIHFLRPAGPQSSVWHLDYQDALAIGRLARSGKVDPTRVLSIAGPAAAKPRLVRTRLGANLSELLSSEVAPNAGEVRRIVGSVLQGRALTEQDEALSGFLSRHALQVSILREGRDREFLGWHMPGGDKFSVKNVYASALQRGKKLFAFTTNTNGSPRAMVPIGSFESVMPLDILPTQLLRALVTNDTDLAQALGALELAEEDLGLLSYVCPGKTDYAPLLRTCLNTIEKDG